MTDKILGTHLGCTASEITINGEMNHHFSPTDSIITDCNTHGRRVYDQLGVFARSKYLVALWILRKDVFHLEINEFL